MNPATQVCRIRRMTAADLSRVIVIAGSLRQAPQWPRAVYETAVDSGTAPKRIALVAEDAASGAMAAYAVARFAPPEAELETLAVSFEFQRRGVARQLFEALAAELRRESVSEVVLEVRVSNQPAQALYQSLGFNEVGGRRRYYADPVEDAVVMRMKLA